MQAVVRKEEKALGPYWADSVESHLTSMKTVVCKEEKEQAIFSRLNRDPSPYMQTAV